MYIKVLLIAVASICVGAWVPTANVRLEGDVNRRIIGAKAAPEGADAYPYQVSLRVGGHPHCGGSIIAPAIILTAASCVYGYSSNRLSVVVGSNKLDSAGTTHQVKTTIMHEKYNDETAEHNIALLKLSSSIEYTPKVAPIELETAEIDAGVTVTLTGWGMNRFPFGYPNSLQYICLKTIGNSECAQRWKGKLTVYDTQICTLTREGEGACTEDQGGALVAHGKQVGILSSFYSCAIGYPDLYTRTSSYIEWINEHSK